MKIASAKLPLILLIVIPVAGCAKSKLPVHPVKMSVFHNTRPAVNAEIVLHPLDENPELKSLRPNGRVDEKGALQLSTYQQGDGAPAGQYRVTVHWQVPLVKSDDPETALEQSVDPTHGRYSDPGSSPLKVTVVSGPNELPAIELATP